MAASLFDLMSPDRSVAAIHYVRSKDEANSKHKHSPGVSKILVPKPRVWYLNYNVVKRDGISLLRNARTILYEASDLTTRLGVVVSLARLSLVRKLNP